MSKLRRALVGLAAFALAACSLAAQQLPRKAGDWTIQTADGKQIQLAAYRGKVVVLAFILTTCPHCQKTVGVLSGLEPKYAPLGVQILASAVNSGARQALPEFVQTFRPAFPVGYNEDGSKVLDFCQFAPMRMPLMPIVLLIDRQGNVRFEHEGHDEKFFNDQEQNFRSELDSLLKPAARKK